MSTPEDEEAKKQVQEAVWAWAVRVLVLAVAFGFGFFAGWVLYGAGPSGAVQLRAQLTDLDGQLLDCKNKRVDSDGKVTVLQTRLDECNRSLAKALSPPSPPPANPQ